MARPKAAPSPRLVALIGEESARNLTAIIGDDAKRGIDTELAELEKLGQLRGVRFALQMMNAAGRQSEKQLAAQLEQIAGRLEQVAEAAASAPIIVELLSQTAHQLGNVVRAYGAVCARLDEQNAGLMRLALLAGDHQTFEQFEAAPSPPAVERTPAGPIIAPAARVVGEELTIELYRQPAAAA